MKWKLFCTKTMKTYYVQEKSLYWAVRKLASELGVPVSCIKIPAD